VSLASIFTTLSGTLTARERLVEVETCGVNTAFGAFYENVDQDKRRLLCRAKP
jgi:hypothetical protein